MQVGVLYNYGSQTPVHDMHSANTIWKLHIQLKESKQMWYTP